MRSRPIRSVSAILSDDVKTPRGNQLGTLTNLIMDVDQGVIAYAVLAVGDALGVRNKHFAIPWNALNFDEQQHSFILNVEREVFEQAPGLDPDEWPDPPGSEREGERRWFSTVNRMDETDPDTPE